MTRRRLRCLFRPFCLGGLIGTFPSLVGGYFDGPHDLFLMFLCKCVLVAKAAGAGWARILRSHLRPNAMASMIVVARLEPARAILWLNPYSQRRSAPQ